MGQDMCILCDLHKNKWSGILRQLLRVTWLTMTFLELECKSSSPGCPSLLSNLRNEHLRNEHSNSQPVMFGTQWGLDRNCSLSLPWKTGSSGVTLARQLVSQFKYHGIYLVARACEGYAKLITEGWHWRDTDPGGQVCPQPGRVLLGRKQVIVLLQTFSSGNVKIQPGPGSAHIMSL